MASVGEVINHSNVCIVVVVVVIFCLSSKGLKFLLSALQHLLRVVEQKRQLVC